MIFRRIAFLLVFLISTPWIVFFGTIGLAVGAVSWLITGKGFDAFDSIMIIGVWHVDKIANWAKVM